jgi:hypothetical protein
MVGLLQVGYVVKKRDKGTKAQRKKVTKMQPTKLIAGKRDKETKGQRDKGVQ